MNPRILDISNKIKIAFLDSLSTENLITIFLCGGSTAIDAKYRRKLGQSITKIHSKYQYSVYYPEDMFIELILGHQRKDLLMLEDLLATGVHSVVILLQSSGTIAELGAFTNYPDLADKLIVVVEPKYRLKRSFIALGPIRHLQSQTRSKVIYSEMNESNLAILTKQLSEAAREIAKSSHPVNDLSNPITSQKFFLAMMYVFDPIGKEALIAIANELSTCGQDITTTVAESVINGLVNERKALSNANTLSITAKGIDALIYDSVLKEKSRYSMLFLSSLRLEALNLTLRKRYIKTGGAIGA